MIRHTTSASNLFRRAVCPASHWLEDGLPEEENEVSQMGTLGHAHFAYKAADRSTLTDEMQWLLAIADEEERAFFARVAEEEGIEAEQFRDEREGEGWITNARGAQVVPGHWDSRRHWPHASVLAIADLKLGYIPVTSAERNMQLAAYAVMGAQLTGAKKVYCAIIQPRLPRGERFTMCMYTAAGCRVAKEEILSILGRVRDAEGERGRPGEEQCRNCKAKLRCDAFREAASLPATILPPELTKKTAPAALEALTDEKLSALGDALTLARMIDDGWKAEARRRIEAGQMQGWELKPGNTRREITDALKAFALLDEATGGRLGFDEIFMRACKVSREDLKRPVAELMGIPQTKADIMLKEVLKPATEEKQNAPSVVRKGAA